MTVKADVIVVGGGPAGSTTARIAKCVNSDLDVKLFESRKVIGRPVNCAGGIVNAWLDEFGIKLPPSVIAHTTKGVKIVGPYGSSWTHHQDDINIDKPLVTITHRDKFDAWNLSKARKEGVDISMNDNPARWDKPYDFDAKYIIGADGWRSGFGKHHKIISESKTESMHVGYELRVDLKEYDQDYLTFILDRRYAPEGYVWAFPEGNGIVKIGNAVSKHIKRSPKYYLMKFFKENPEYRGEIVDQKPSGSGIIPLSLPPTNYVKKKNGSWYGLVGDAARMVDPLHGGGIATALCGGILLGKAISLSRPLTDYQKKWNSLFLDEHIFRYAFASSMKNWTNLTYEKVVKSLSGFKFGAGSPHDEAAKLFMNVVNNCPGILNFDMLLEFGRYARSKFL